LGRGSLVFKKASGAISDRCIVWSERDVEVGRVYRCLGYGEDGGCLPDILIDGIKEDGFGCVERVLREGGGLVSCFNVGGIISLRVVFGAMLR
jgi:hypothetical protein